MTSPTIRARRGDDGRLDLRLRGLRRGLSVWRDELAASRGLPFRRRWQAWRAGYTMDQWQLYGLDELGVGRHVPALSAAFRAYRINGFYNPIVGDKLMFTRWLQSAGVPCPQALAFVSGGALRSGAIRLPGRPLPALLALLDAAPQLVFRPTWSGGGHGVFFLERHEGALSINGVGVSSEYAIERVTSLDRVIITARLQQAAYANTIFPGTSNTVRLLTLLDADTGEPFLAGAAHRFGTERSAPLDSFDAGRGGICAALDAASGLLGRAVSLDAQRQPIWSSVHPDTGARIVGVRVPTLPACIEQLLELARGLPFCPLIGWDVLFTDDGFAVIEANPLPALSVWDVHTPLLDAPRVQRFFAHHGVVNR